MAECPHGSIVNSVCTLCGRCFHEVVLNAICYFCGEENPEVTVAAPSEEPLVPVERLKRPK